MEQFPGKMDKAKKAKYFVGNKKLKHVKLFENFDLNEKIDTPFTLGNQAAVALFAGLHPEEAVGDKAWKAFIKMPLATVYKKLGETSGLWNVFNGTDGVYATFEPVSLEDAIKFIEGWPKRYEKQGYYKTNKWEKIDPSDVHLRLEPANEGVEEKQAVSTWIDNLPKDVKTVGDAEKLILELSKVGKLYHFDDDPADIINSNNKRVFSDEEATIISKLMDKAFEVAEKKWPGKGFWDGLIKDVIANSGLLIFSASPDHVYVVMDNGGKGNVKKATAKEYEQLKSFYDEKEGEYDSDEAEAWFEKLASI